MYQYYCTQEQLYDILQKSLIEFKDAFNGSFAHFDKNKSFMKSFKSHLPKFEERLIGLHVFMVACIVNVNVFDKGRDFSDAEIDEVITKEVTDKLEFKDELHNKAQLTKMIERISEANYQVKLDQMMQIVEGKRSFCHPAVYCTLIVVLKLVEMIKQSLSVLHDKPESALHNKSLLKDVSLLSKCFIIFYSAMFENANDIFYQREVTDDIKMLLDAAEFHEPHNKDEHYKLLKKGEKQLNYFASIASYSMKKSNS